MGNDPRNFQALGRIIAVLHVLSRTVLGEIDGDIRVVVFRFDWSFLTACCVQGVTLTAPQTSDLLFSVFTTTPCVSYGAGSTPH